MCGGARSAWASLGLPRSGVCDFPVAQAPGCSAGALSKAGPGLRALPSSEPLRFRFSGAPQRRRLSWACVLCPAEVRAAQATRCLARAVSPGGRCVSSPPGPGCSESRARSRSAVSGGPCVSSGELISAATLLVDVNRPGSREDLVSNWEPARSLVEDAVSGAELALPSGSGCCPPGSLPPAGDGPVCSRLALLRYLLSPSFCGQCLRLELFMGKFYFFFSLSLWLSHSLGMSAPSHCPQGIQARSLP